MKVVGVCVGVKVLSSGVFVGVGPETTWNKGRWSTWRRWNTQTKVDGRWSIAVAK